MSSTATPQQAVRRSTRIRAQIPIRISSADPALDFSEYCHTLVVNIDGCGVRLGRPLDPGLPLSLDQLPCGKTVPARVANCIPLGTQGRFWLVGIVLDQPENVWCIQPAPEDWSSDFKPSVAVASPPKKTGQWPYSSFSNKGESHPGRK
ncbi:MAG: PilZ domain-containing protein [Terriglobales bacterium]